MAAVLVGLVAGAAAAETLVDAYGLGRHRPVPEEWTKVDEDWSVRARLVRGKSGSLMPVAKRGETVTLDLAFYTQPGVADREIALVCSVFFYDARGESSDYPVEDAPCYQGRLSDAAEQFQTIPLGFKFRPQPGDPKGTSAVVVSVRDRLSGDGVALAPTYDWQGGR